MGSELFDLLGVDPDNPRIVAAMQDAKDAERLIDTLVDLRIRQGLTQSDIAAEMETTQSAVSKFERAGGDPRLSTIQRYARASGARIRLVVEVSRQATPAWQASYKISAAIEPGVDETEYITTLAPVIEAAS